MNLVSRSLLLVAAGLLAAPARAELAGLSSSLRAKARDLRQLRALADEEDAAALRELRAEGTSMPDTSTAELIVQSGPSPANLAAALDSLASDLVDPNKDEKDAVLDVFDALGIEIDPNFLEFYEGCVGGCADADDDAAAGLGPFTCSCLCLAFGTGARPPFGPPGTRPGVRSTICQIVGPIVDQLDEAGIGANLFLVVAQILGLIDAFFPNFITIDYYYDDDGIP